jgi:hypothetical protein
MTTHSVDVLPTETPARPPANRGPSTPILVTIVAAAMLVAAVAFITVTLRGQTSETHAATVASDTAPVVLTMDVLCKRTDQIGNDLRSLGACGDKVDKAKSAVDGQPVPPVAQGLARDDVVAIVQAQIAGKVVTSDQVLTLITQVYNANRPKDAPPPTGDQVLSAVQAVCGTTKCQGPQGVRGDDAPAVTDEQLFATVSRYCSGPDAPCKGAPGAPGERGPQGSQGVSIVAQTFARNDQGECRNYITLSSDAGRRIDSGPASDAACPVPEPPVTTPPTP